MPLWYNVITSLIMGMSNIDCANKTRSDRIRGPRGRGSGGGLQSHSMQWMTFRVLLIDYVVTDSHCGDRDNSIGASFPSIVHRVRRPSSWLPSHQGISTCCGD